METILPYLGVEAIYTDKELEKMTIKVPNFVGWTVSAAKKYCKDKGLDLEIVGPDEGIIRRQYPEKDVVVEKNSARILAYTDKEIPTETVNVPDVTGMSAVAANQVLINAGLNIRILGTKNYLSGTGATVVSQSVAAGETVPRGTVVEVTFRHLDDKDYNDDWSTLN
jgi:stage V sporulation protein D (sporulation-specific penicillin-binding protein)